MASRDIEQILNSSLPSVGIGRVILENAGGEYQFKIDPHIDYTVKDDTIGKEFIAAELLNPQRIEGTTLKRNNANAMKVTLSLSVKDVVTASILSYWFKNRNIVDLLDVRATYTTDPNTTNYILQNNRTLNYEDYLDITNIPLQTALKKKGFRNEIVKVDADGDRIHIFNFDYVINVDNSVPYLAVFACCRVDLNKLFKKAPETLQIQTDIVDQLPDDLLAGNLSYNVVLRDGNISSTIPVFVDEEAGTLWNGPIHQMANGEWMTGDIHSVVSKLLIRRNIPNTRIQDFRISSYLNKRVLEIHNTRAKISNTISRGITSQVVDDQKPKSYFSDISFARDTLGQARFFFSMDYHKIIEDYTLFGGLIRKKGLLDPNEIALEYCRIASLKIFRKRIHGSAETGSKVYMVANTLNGDIMVPHDPATLPGNFDCNQVDELIVSTSEDGGRGILRSNEYSKIHDTTPINVMPSLGEHLGLISPVSSLVGDPTPPQFLINKTVIGTIEEITGIKVNGSEGVRYISGIDKSMPGVTDGYYQYRIEMEIIDRTDEFIMKYLDNLQWARKYLQIYLNKITQPGQEASFTWKTDPHIDYEQEGKTVSRRDKFVADRATIKKAINYYLKTMMLFTNETTASRNDYGRPENGDALRDQLLSFVNPRTPNGTACIIGLMGELINKIQDALKIRELGTMTKAGNDSLTLQAIQPSTLFNSSKPTISFEVENLFVNYFNSNVERDASYDFMDLADNETPMGIKLATEDEFISRIGQETQRLFRNEEDSLSFSINDQEFNPGDDFQFTDFSYVAPARVNMPAGQSLKVVGPSPGNSQSAYQGVNWARIANQVAQASERASSEAPTESIAATNKMASYGVTIHNDLRSIAKAFEVSISDPVNKDNQVCSTHPSAPGANPFPLFERVLEEINPNSYQFGGPYESTGQSQINEDRASLAKTIRNINTIFDPNSITSPANTFLTSFASWTPSFLYRGRPHSNNLTPSQGWTTTTPNHFKALSKKEVLPTNIANVISAATFKSSAQAEVNLKFFTLDVIEVLIGYQEDQLTKPLWEPLTRTIYNEAIGETLFCRLTPYQNRIFGATRNKESELPTVDEYFLLQPRSKQAVAAVEDLAPGISVTAFPSLGTTFLFGDLPGISRQTFYVEPEAPINIDVRFGVGERIDLNGLTYVGDPPSDLVDGLRGTALEGSATRTTDLFGEVDNIVGFGINDLDPRLQGIDIDTSAFSAQEGSLTQDRTPMQRGRVNQASNSGNPAPTQTTRTMGSPSFAGSNPLASGLNVAQNARSARSAQRPDALLNTSRSSTQGGRQS